jgi:HPt (histidine-containing phosphotransfer) domain-containing protein
LEGKKLKGVDFDRGLRRFGGDSEAYLQALRSFLAHSPAILASLRLLEGSLGGDFGKILRDYAIQVHGLKGACYTIGAEDLGKEAEALENAARGGRLDLARARNGPFMGAVEALLQDLGPFLAELKPGEEKPLKPAPEGELLRGALEAAGDYDIDRLEAVLTRLEACHYQTGEDLVRWLREEASRSEFGKIRRRLGEELKIDYT